MESSFQTRAVAKRYDHLAPDGSEIRLLSQVGGAGLCHCTLPEGRVSSPVYHKTVEELWFFLSGKGQFWRKTGDVEDIVSVCAGVSLSITVGTAFQFRNTGRGPLCCVIATIPPWPGADEAVPTKGKWNA
jgi:mannose-6-phosphate isomerase-like protein (cupin superfamily)